MISGSTDKTARRWDLEAGHEIEEMRDVCETGVLAVGVSRDGRWVVTGGGDLLTHTQGELKVCDVETGNLRKFEGHSDSGKFDCIDISADSKLLASVSCGGCTTVQMWSLKTGKLVTGLMKSTDWVDAVRFSQDSKKLAVKSWWEDILEVWDVATQSLDVRVEKIGLESAPMFWTTKNTIVLVAAFSSGFAGTHAISEFDASTSKIVGASFKGHIKIVTSLALSLDCALLASASDDNTIKLWAFESRQLLASFDVMDARHLTLSPDSRQIAYTTLLGKNIYLCNTPPEILATIQHVPQVRVRSQP
jgi:WD40 repeat protein